MWARRLPPVQVASMNDIAALLVFGGFRRDTRRAEILQTVQRGIKELNLEGEVDRECFATGPRRSFCLLPFVTRTGEQTDHMRERMRKVLLAFQTRQLPIPGHDKTLWCAFSRPKDARDRAGHCRMVRAAIYYFCKEKIDEVDADYVTGTCWLGSTLLSSAVSSPPDDGHRLFRVETKAGRPPHLSEGP